MNTVNARKVRSKRNGQKAMIEAVVAFLALHTLRALRSMETTLNRRRECLL